MYKNERLKQTKLDNIKKIFDDLTDEEKNEFIVFLMDNNEGILNDINNEKQKELIGK